MRQCTCEVEGSDRTKRHSPLSRGYGVFYQLDRIGVPYATVVSCWNHLCIYNAAARTEQYWEFVCYVMENTDRTSMTGNSNPWVRNWDVTGSSGDLYKVSQRADGSYGCSCPGWKFRSAPKPDCKHIKAIKQTVEEPKPSIKNFKAPPRYAPYQCSVCSRIFSSTNALNRHFEIQHEQKPPRKLPVEDFFYRPKPTDKFRFLPPEEEKTAKPQEVEVNGDRFSIVRKFKFASE